MDLKALVKETAFRTGMDMCGVAGIDRFAESPKGAHPTDILPGCKSVIVIGVRLLEGIVQVNFRTFEDGREDLKGLYGTYGYAMLPNFALTYSCYQIAQVIERNTGAFATPLSTGPYTNGRQISIRHCAVAAGLGEFGWMSIVLTPDFGPRNRFGVILTTAEIEPDPMYSGPKLCDPETCNICTDACPTKAIGIYGSDNCHSCTLGENSYTYAKVNFQRCSAATMGLRKKFGGKEDWLTTDDPTQKEINEANEKKPATPGGFSRGEAWHCGKCLSYCPAGKWNEKFINNNFSGGLNNDKWGY